MNISLSKRQLITSTGSPKRRARLVIKMDRIHYRQRLGNHSIGEEGQDPAKTQRRIDAESHKTYSRPTPQASASKSTMNSVDCERFQAILSGRPLESGHAKARRTAVAGIQTKRLQATTVYNEHPRSLRRLR